MKKFLLFMVLFLAGTVVFAEVNMPSGPSMPTKKVVRKSIYDVVDTSNSVNNTTSYTSDSVAGLAKSIAVAELNDNRSESNAYYKKMLSKGATNVKTDIHVNACPYRKGIPPVTVGGKTYTGKKCVIVYYTYNGKSTGTGACK